MKGEALQNFVNRLVDDKPIEELPTLKEIQQRAQAQVAALPDGVRLIGEAQTYPVQETESLRRLSQSLQVR